MRIIGAEKVNGKMSKKIVGFSLIPGFIFLASTLFASLGRRWDLLGLVPQKINFGDARVLTTAAYCTTTDPNWDPANTLCESYGIYNYPRYWAVIFGKIGITTDQTDILGLSFLLLLSIAFSLLTYQSLKANFSWLSIGFFTIMALSPPVILLAERGNTDSLIFFLVAISSVLMLSGKGLISITLLLLGGFFKVYPFGGALGIFAQKKNLKLRLTFFIILSIVTAIFLIPYIGLIAAKTPQSNYASFGAKLIPYQIFGPESSTTMPKRLIAIGFLVFGVVFVFIWLLLKLRVFDSFTVAFNSLIEALIKVPNLASSFVTGVGVFCFAYLIGISWDYRLVYLFIPVAALLAVKDLSLARWLLSLILLEMYFSYLSGNPNEAIGDWIWLILAPILLLISFEIIVRQTGLKLFSVNTSRKSSLLGVDKGSLL